MTFDTLIADLISDTRSSLRDFGPELVLCATIVSMLLVRILCPRRLQRVGESLGCWLPLVGTLLALGIAAPWEYLDGAGVGEPIRRELFTGFLIFDPLTIFFRSFLLVFAALLVIFTRLSGIPDRQDATDFYTLVLGATLGMCLMASANHMLMVFLAVEMASIPSYALVGFRKNRRQSSEAAIKYAVYGAGTAGIMLYGISLLTGVLGTAHIPTMAVRLAEVLPQPGAPTMALALGGLMMAVGLCFKLSAVPFHFWCPDAFEGGSAEVNAFLSVASKGAALALVVRLALGLGHVGPINQDSPAMSALPAATISAAADDSVRMVALTGGEQDHAGNSAAGAAGADAQVQADPLAPARRFMIWVIGGIAILTCTFGNLAAYGQENINRLLAYSTIAHAGYMMMPIAAAVALLDSNTLEAQRAIGYLAFYICAYLVMNLGAFAIVAFLRNAMNSEQISSYAGLIRQCPWLAICFSLILLSLIGIPPMVGFMAKLTIFTSVVAAELWVLVAVGTLNTVVSLFYYLRVIKTMTIDPEPEDRLPLNISVISGAGVFVVFITAWVMILGVFGDRLLQWTSAASAALIP